MSTEALDAPADCTIACEKGHITVHKLVLCEHSKYLQDILNKYPQAEHPIIILTELNIIDMKILINYMYTGELVITSDSSPSSLLRAAQILKIDSLTSDISDSATATSTGAPMDLDGLSADPDEDDEDDDDFDPESPRPPPGQQHLDDVQDRHLDHGADEDEDDDNYDGDLSGRIDEDDFDAEIPGQPQDDDGFGGHLRTGTLLHQQQQHHHRHLNRHHLLPDDDDEDDVRDEDYDDDEEEEEDGDVAHDHSPMAKAAAAAAAASAANIPFSQQLLLQHQFLQFSQQFTSHHLNLKELQDTFSKATSNCSTIGASVGAQAATALAGLASIDNKNNKIRCHLCNIGLSDVKCLYRHVLTRHLPEKWGYKCEFCDREFSRDDHLMRHYTTKHKNMEFNREKIRETRRLNREMAKNFHDQISTT